MDNEQKVLYITNKMCNRLNSMEINLGITENEKYDPVNNKEDLVELMTAKLNLEDYLKEIEKFKNSLDNLNLEIPNENFIVHNIIDNNKIILENKFEELHKLKIVIDSCLKQIELNRKLK